MNRRGATVLLATGCAVIAGGCSSAVTTSAVTSATADAGSAIAVSASPAGPTSDLCQAITAIAPAASKLLRVKRGFAGVLIQPGTPLPATAGQTRCLGVNSAAGVIADTCISPLVGIDVSVYDAKTSLAVMDGTLAATHPLAEQTVGGRYHVQVNLGGFVTPSGSNVMENGTDAACAPDAALARQILIDLLGYYEPAPIT